MSRTGGAPGKEETAARFPRGRLNQLTGMLALTTPSRTSSSVTLSTARLARAIMSSTWSRVVISAGGKAEDITLRHGARNQVLFQRGS